MNRYWQGVVIIVATTILVAVTVIFAVRWQIDVAKKNAIETAKEIVVTPEKIDNTAKIAGRAVFEFKNFKDKVKEEAKRLQDSTNAQNKVQK